MKRTEHNNPRFQAYCGWTVTFSAESHLSKHLKMAGAKKVGVILDPPSSRCPHFPVSLCCCFLLACSSARLVVIQLRAFLSLCLSFVCSQAS